MNNQFQTDPMQSEPMVRHPFAFGLETSVSERLAVEATLSDGIGLGLKAGLLSEEEGGVDLALGFDELLFPVESHLFGLDSQNLTWVPGRAWVGVAQTWNFLRVRGAVTMRPTTDGLEFAPRLATETAFKGPLSFGWELAWEDQTFRNSIGVAGKHKTIMIAGGLSEVQAWIFRAGAFGWFPSPPKGKTDGVGNPGWWFALKWDLPPLKRSESSPAPIPVVRCPAPVLDESALQPVADLLQQRMLREEIAELAVRAGSEMTTDPVAMAVLRRRILAGGASARQALWRIALDPIADEQERRQAAITLGENPKEADLKGLDALSQDPAPSLRLEAAMALGRIGTREADRSLVVLTRDPEESVRLAAKAAMER